MRDWEQTEARYNLEIQTLRERISRLQEQANGTKLYNFVAIEQFLLHIVGKRVNSTSY